MNSSNNTLKHYHGVSYGLGCLNLFSASIILQPIFLDICDSFYWAGWFYVFASMGLLASSSMEWLIQKNSSSVLNLGKLIPIWLNFLSSSLLLISSTLYTPYMNIVTNRQILLMISFGLIIGASIWKVRSLGSICSDLNSFLIHMFALGGSTFYTISQLLFHLTNGTGITDIVYFITGIYLVEAQQIAKVIPRTIALFLLAFGGFLFFLSALVQIKQTFSKNNTRNAYNSLAKNDSFLEL